ncbi:unnamed protein product [Sphenostylis stenocarpa]|uniref:Uncharacterized protein n=1 Tax=Sphenostylis stenocarpa TaxID=92480 RepID=A0AA86SNU3_9FABA|nr:unnamed protein product [Sphenostylis stenocarpa]
MATTGGDLGTQKIKDIVTYAQLWKRIRANKMKPHYFPSTSIVVKKWVALRDD